MNRSKGKKRTPNKRNAKKSNKKFTATKGRANTTGSTYWATLRPFQGSALAPRPKKDPHQTYRIRQAVNTFNSQSGISGGSSYPFFAAQDATVQFPTLAFTLADLSQESTVAGLFDQYRIDEVEIIITPSSSVADLHTAASPNQINPQVCVVADFDDLTPLTSLSAAQQYENNVTFNGTQGCHIRIRPSISPAVWSNGAFSGYAVEGPNWLDCNSDTVPHFGLKFVVQGLSTSSTEFWQWNFQAYYHMSFQNYR